MAAKDDLAKVEEARERGDKQIIYEGVTYTLAEMGGLIRDLRVLAKAEADEAKKKAEAEAKTFIKTPKTVEAAQKAVADAQANFDRVLERFNKNTLDAAAVEVARTRLNTAKESLARVSARPITSAEPIVTTPAADGSFEAAEEARLARLETVVTPDGDDKGGGGTPPKKVTRANVTAELAKRGLPDTPENRAAIRSELSGKKPAAPTYQVGWEDEVRRQYAKYSWMLDELDREKYRDVFDLLAEAVNPQTKITDPALFLTRFEATSWYKELATQQMGRRVREQVGALSFDSGNYARLLNNAMRYGWEGDNLKAEAYKEVFRRNDDGNFANPNAIGEARKSNDYLRVKSIGTSYLSQMSDDRIVEVLTGGITSDDLLRIYREKAKVNNPHLAAAIDAGVTLEDMAYDYRKVASDVLGTPLSGIPLTEDFVGQALKTGEPGKYRVMSTNEWKYLLKSNPDFGYQYTTNARKEVNDLVSSLEKAFGFVK
jgi:hypothetical protein